MTRSVLQPVTGGADHADGLRSAVFELDVELLVPTAPEAVEAEGTREYYRSPEA